jgi:hypothetical protein
MIELNINIVSQSITIAYDRVNDLVLCRHHFGDEFESDCIRDDLRKFLGNIGVNFEDCRKAFAEYGEI